MTPIEPDGTRDPEFVALDTVYGALRSLDAPAQERVIAYVAQKLGLLLKETTFRESHSREVATPAAAGSAVTPSAAATRPEEEALEGISPIAKKWMARNGLTTQRLSSLFSLGMDEIDFVATTVPGKSKRERMRNVLLLKAIAAYLSGGVARVSHEELKEACLHYDAYDSPNHAKYLKSLGAELNGTKEAGYTLTPRGITAATDVVKRILEADKSE